MANVFKVLLIIGVIIFIMIKVATSVASFLINAIPNDSKPSH
jgi:hypothetical protein